jgi:hypothetical protein
MTVQHFLLRLTRGGPLVPARLQELDHEFGEPDNHRDRWPPTVLVADIAGEIVPPEELTDRFHWKAGHWKHAAAITEGEYRHLMDVLRWAERNQPDHPSLRPRRRIDPRTARLPSFGAGR